LRVFLDNDWSVSLQDIDSLTLILGPLRLENVDPSWLSLDPVTHKSYQWETNEIDLSHVNPTQYSGSVPEDWNTDPDIFAGEHSIVVGGTYTAYAGLNAEIRIDEMSSDKAYGIIQTSEIQSSTTLLEDSLYGDGEFWSDDGDLSPKHNIKGNVEYNVDRIKEYTDDSYFLAYDASLRVRPFRGFVTTIGYDFRETDRNLVINKADANGVRRGAEHAQLISDTPKEYFGVDGSTDLCDWGTRPSVLYVVPSANVPYYVYLEDMVIPLDDLPGSESDWYDEVQEEGAPCEIKVTWLEYSPDGEEHPGPTRWTTVYEIGEYPNGEKYVYISAPQRYYSGFGNFPLYRGAGHPPCWNA